MTRAVPSEGYRIRVSIPRVTLTAMCAMAIGGSSPARLAGQAAAAGGQRATRAQLTERVVELERMLAQNPNPAERARVVAEVAAIRGRLEEGDFRVGNQFVVTVTAPVLNTSDTVTVRDSLLVTFAKLPDASVRGVLRSELNERLSAHVARFVKEPQVRVNVLTRLTVVGSVNRPGLVYVSPDRPIGELIQLAGGPAQDAKLDELEVKRNGTSVLSRKNSKRALKEGRTLEQLDIRSGDDVTIPKKRRINWQAIFQGIALFSTLFFAALQLIRLYYDSKE